MTFKRIAVIGAGTMGSGIAGQIANAGHRVLLLDLNKDATVYALELLQKSEPAPLHQRSNIDLIETGTIDHDFEKLVECDWIVEAIVERLDIKRDLYRRLDAVISKNCIVTSNTSNFVTSDIKPVPIPAVPLINNMGIIGAYNFGSIFIPSS